MKQCKTITVISQAVCLKDIDGVPIGTGKILTAPDGDTFAVDFLDDEGQKLDKDRVFSFVYIGEPLLQVTTRVHQ